MNLSAEQFATVISSLQQPLHVGLDERRRARRVVHRARVPIMLFPGTPQERQATITIRDLSPRGMGFLHTERLPNGTPFIVRVERQDGHGADVLCNVVHCRLPQGGVYSIGAEFTCLLTNPGPITAAKAAADMERIRKSMFS